MKKLFTNVLTAIILLLIPTLNFAQAPPLGTAANFALFTSIGAVSNVGIPYLTLITGNVGTNSAPTIPGFGNVDGQMHYVGDPGSAQCSADLVIAYNALSATIPTFFPAPLLGNGQILVPGVYSISAPATLNLDLTLDALGDPNAVFIIKIQGSFSTNTNAKVILINNALACNVFWQVEGLVSMSTGTTMRGTIIANNGAIDMAVGDTLEGRALSTAGAITVGGVLVKIPIGCGSPVLTGPIAPTLASVACYTLFSSIGPVTNTGITYVTGDIGTNNGLTTGYNPLFVTGAIHPIPDGSTAQCSVDLLNVYSYLNALPYDIELLFPPLFGHDLVLTPHTYIMNGAVTFTDSVFLDGQGDPNAVFVIKIYGALSTSTYSKVKLINGTQVENVYWLVSGAVSISDYSVFNGTIICNNGAMDLLQGTTLNGRALTTVGALGTNAITAIMPAGCGGLIPPTIITEPLNQIACEGDSVSFLVAATGPGLTYKWRKGGTDLVNGGNISGVTTAILTIDPASILDAALNYNVVVIGTNAPSDTSINVSLTVNTAPFITAEPSNQISCVGDSVSFSVAATGTNLSYQWRKGVVNILGATNAMLTINPVNLLDAALDYNVVVTGTCFPSDTSMNVSLSLNVAPIIITEPLDQIACVGDSVSFSIVANGSGLTYQWRKGVVNILGETSAVLTINPVSISDASPNYNVVVFGLCSANDTSIFVSLTVNALPVAYASSNSPVCIDSTIYLTAQTVALAVYSWTGPNGYTSLIQNPIILTSTLVDAGDYALTVSLNGCNSIPSIATVVVNNCNSDLSIIKTVDNTTPLIGQSVVFTITVTNNGPYAASGVAVNDILQSGYVYVSSTATAGTYNPLVGVWTIGTMNNGASETLTVTVTVIAGGNYVNTAIVYGDVVDLDMTDNVSSIETYPTDFNIPEGFSPNSDGINDLFVIRGIENYPKNTFVIYNRWGVKVFEASPYQNNWNGKSAFGITIGGSILPSGTYFYVLDLGDGSDVYKGTIYLNR